MLPGLTTSEIDRIIEMAWEDRTPFEAIEAQFGLSEQQVIRLMKANISLKAWKRWRARVHGRTTKHQVKWQTLSGSQVTRHKSPMQRIITGNRISKR